MTTDMPAVELLALIESLDITPKEKQALRDTIATLVQQKWEIARAIKDLEE